MPTPEQIIARQHWAIDNLTTMRERMRQQVQELRIEKEFAEYPHIQQRVIERCEAQLMLLDLLFTGNYE